MIGHGFARRPAAAFLLAAVLVLTAVAAVTALSPAPASADPSNPHLSSGVTTDTCASCHRSHTGQAENFLEVASETGLCLSCHDGTGADTNVVAEYTDVNVPPDEPLTSTYYGHRPLLATDHTSGLVDEFAGVLNRHAACGDCHNPHAANGGPPAQTVNGWTASGSIAGITGVSLGQAWQTSVGLEYELCLKCHSRYTVIVTSGTPTGNQTDKAAEIDPNAASYHPVAAPGKNTTPQLQESLDGGALWQLSTNSTIRCTQCHGNYRLVGDPPFPNVPQITDRLAPHTSRYPGILIANYRNRDLKPQSEAYAAGDFALCYLCHSEAPFSTTAQDVRTDTNFQYHGTHLTSIAELGSGGTDINIAGAGQGNAVCSECHFETHGTALAPWDANRGYSRGVNFAPNVEARAADVAPRWDAGTRTCALVCHGEDHDAAAY